MIGKSSNRQTRITLFETGDAASSNRVVTTSVNYQQKTFLALKKHIEGSLRTKPTDPAYDIETMSFKDKNSKEDFIITADNYEELKDTLFEQSTVYMKTKVSCRASSPMKGRARRDSQNDENNAPNPSQPTPLQVRRAGSPPRRDVCSPLRRNLNKSTTSLPSSPAATSTTSVVTPNSSLRSTIRGASSQRNGSPLRAGSPSLRASSPLVKTAPTSRHKSPGNIRRSRVSSATTPAPTTPGAPSSATKETNLRLLSRSSIKKVRASPPVKIKENKDGEGSIQSTDVNKEPVKETERDVDDIALENMTISSPVSNDQPDAESQIILESPIASHNETWKEIYTPRSSHNALDNIDLETPVITENVDTADDVARKIFLEDDSSPTDKEETPVVSSEPPSQSVEDDATVTTTASSTTTSTPSRRPSRTKEATPKFNVKEKIHQAATEEKVSRTQTSSKSNVPSFMKETRSFQNHVNHDGKEKIADLKWEKRLRKNDNENISRKVQSTFRDRSSKFNANMLKAIRSDTKTLMPDGRPSLDTMTAQWEFMRNQFLGSNDEALEWMMQAKSGGAPAYKHASRKHQIAEDQYFKSLFEIDILEAKLKILSGPSSKVTIILKAIASCSDVLSLNPTDAERKATVKEQQQLLKAYFQEELKGICCQNLQKDIQAVFELSEECKAAKKARHVVNNSYPAELSEMKERLRKCNQAKEESLTEMEKWDARVKETAEYEKVLVQQEIQWMEEFSEGNLMCLRQMRSLIPNNIAQLSINDLMKEVREKGALYTQELAVEIKNNKLLHWLQLAPEDIALTNFLSGEHRQYFVNIDGLDVVEMRALRMVLPEKFELDQDGQKAEWRERFISRMKQLVAQQNEDSIKGGWDAEMGRRSMVKLPELKPEQRRRQIYYFRTHEQMVKKLSQYADKAALRDKKQALLNKAMEEEKTWRDEYNIILEESRDPYFRSEVGMESLNIAKTEAKNELKAVESKRKYLESDVKRLQKSINEMAMTQDEYKEMISTQADYLNTIADPPTSEEDEPFDFYTATDSVLITGPFDECPEIKRIERSSAKFQTAEQEAILRKLELSQVKMSETNIESSTEHETSASTSTPFSAAVEHVPSAVDKSMFEKPITDPAASDLLTPQRPRRGSVLLSANKNVIDTLNNMFSPSASRRGSDILPPSGMASGRNSIFSPSTGRRDSAMSVASTGSDGSATVVLEKKSARSKTLQKLMERKDSGSTDEPPKRPPNPFMMAGGGGGGMSFLQQIQAKRKKTEDDDN